MTLDPTASDEDDVFTPGTDLLICLVTILLIVFVIVVRERDTSRAELAGARADDADAAVTRQQLADADARLKSSGEQAAEMDRLRAEAQVAVNLRERLAAVQIEADGLRAQLAVAEKVDRGIRQELLGLKGDLERVVFVVDRSGSMSESGPGRSDMWGPTSETIQKWLTYLPAKHVVLITFGGTALSREPEDGWLVADEVGRGRLARSMAAQQPGGATPTWGALKAAGDIPGVKTIVLMTDGKPTDAEPETVKVLVTELAAKGIVVNTVGLGLYYDYERNSGNQNPVQLLIELAKLGGGAYLAY